MVPEEENVCEIKFFSFFFYWMFYSYAEKEIHALP